MSAPVKPQWREIPAGRRMSRAQVALLKIEDGYPREHIDAFLDACMRSGGFVRLSNGRFFECVGGQEAGL
jgi:hypothetical protein